MPGIGLVIRKIKLEILKTWTRQILLRNINGRFKVLMHSSPSSFQTSRYLMASPVLLMKAVKSPTEIAGMNNAHVSGKPEFEDVRNVATIN